MQSFQKKFGFRSILAPATDFDIASSEKELGKKIPEAYIQFLKEWNGGVFKGYPKPVFLKRVTLFGGEYKPIRWFKGVSFFPNSGLLLTGPGAQDGYRFNKLVPERFLAVGSGNPFTTICISTEGDDFGKVYVWDPVELDPEMGPTEEFLTLIADDFYQFWDKLIEGGIFEES